MATHEEAAALTREWVAQELDVIVGAAVPTTAPGINRHHDAANVRMLYPPRVCAVTAAHDELGKLRRQRDSLAAYIASEFGVDPEDYASGDADSGVHAEIAAQFAVRNEQLDQFLVEAADDLAAILAGVSEALTEVRAGRELGAEQVLVALLKRFGR